MEDTSVVSLSFLAVFHALGGIALGSALRGLWKVAQGERDSVFTHLFFLFFGVLLGCFPLAAGLQATTPLWVLGGQLSVLLVTFIVSLFLGPAILGGGRALFNINSGLILLGLIFIGAGIFGSYTLLGQGVGGLQSLFFGGAFSLVGLGILLLGLINLFR